MGVWKIQISLRIPLELREGMQQFADGEKRKLGNLGEVLLTWAFEQLKMAGSVSKLIERKPRKSP